MNGALRLYVSQAWRLWSIGMAFVVPTEMAIVVLRRMSVPSHSRFIGAHIQVPAGTGTGFTVVSFASIPLAGLAFVAAVAAQCDALSECPGGLRRGLASLGRLAQLVRRDWRQTGRFFGVAAILVGVVRVTVALISTPIIDTVQSITAFLIVSAAINAVMLVLCAPLCAALTTVLLSRGPSAREGRRRPRLSRWRPSARSGSVPARPGPRRP